MSKKPVKCHYCNPTYSGDCDESSDCCHFHLLASITNRCTSLCDHCLQSAGPSGRNHMTLATAAAISSFVRETGATLQIYGGEIICHPAWEEMLKILLNSGAHSYVIHTNGVWEANPALAAKFLAAIGDSDSDVKLAISNDGFHDIPQMERACLFAKTALAEHARLGSIKLLNPFRKSGEAQSNSRRKYHSSLLPLGRARRYACVATSKKRDSCCAHNRPGNGLISNLITPDGSVYAGGCGVKKIGHINSCASERGKNYRSWRQSTPPANCRACIAVHKEDIAWEC